MSEHKQSFWSSLPGLVTGIAGLLTGVVGLVSLSLQQGWVGGDSGSATTTTLLAPGAGPPGSNGGGAGATPTTEVGSFTVTPTALDFQPADPKEKTVTLKNTSSTAALAVRQPRVTGDDAAQFSATFGTCTSARLAAGLSCTLKVAFTPAGPLRQYKAALQVTAEGAPRAVEVPIGATTLL